MSGISARFRAPLVSLISVIALAAQLLPMPRAISHVGTPAPLFESLGTNGAVSYGNPAHRFAGGYLDVDISFSPCSSVWPDYVGIYVRGLDSSGVPSSAWVGPVMTFKYGSDGSGYCAYQQPIHKRLRVTGAAVGNATYHEVEYRAMSTGRVLTRARNTDQVATNAVNGLACLGTHPAHGGSITDCRAIYYNGNVAYGNPNFSVAAGKANLDISWEPCDRDWTEGVNVWLRGVDAVGNPVTDWKAIQSFNYSGSGCSTYVQPIHKHGLTMDSAVAAAPYHEMEFRGEGSGKVFLRARSWGAGARVEDTLGPMCTGNGVPYAINPTGCQSDPVNSATGAFVTAVDDLRMSGVGVPFRMTRSYTSIDRTAGPLGRGWTHSFASALITEANGDMTLRSENGQRTRFALQADGTFRAFRGGRSKLSAITGGFQVKSGDQSLVRFDSGGRPTAFLDHHGNGLTLTYGADGKLSALTDYAGRVVTFTHDAAGRLTNVALPDGRSTSYAYTKGLLTKVTDVRGHDTTYHYDEHQRLSKIVDQNGNAVITNTYGADHRVTEQFDPRGNKTTFSWDPATETSTMTDARGGTWKDVYSYNVLVKRIDPLGNEIVFDHDAGLNVTAVIDPRGNKTRMRYDAEHNLTSVTTPAPLSDVTAFTYDSSNRLVSYTDPRSRTTTFGYSAAGDLMGVTAPGSIVTELARDPATGLVWSVTDPRNKTTNFGYDAAGNLIEVSSPHGRVTKMAYDAVGRLMSIVDPRGNEPGGTPSEFMTTFSYNPANAVRSIVDALGHTTSWSYDPGGRTISMTDAKIRTTMYAYNASNLLASVTAPDATVTRYTYDTVGNLATREDAKQHETAYSYDGANRLTRMTSPTGQRWDLEYDAAGNLSKVTDAVGNVTPDPGDGTTIYGYDQLNRVESIDYSDATPDVVFGYNEMGDMISMGDGLGTETYAFDELSRLTSVTRGDDVFSYEYDAAGNLTRRTLPDGTSSTMTYDDDGNVVSVTTGSAVTAYEYDPAGNLTKTILPVENGHTETRSYDRAGRLVEVKNVTGAEVLSWAAYERDAVGNPTNVTTESGVSTYAYDRVDRLIEGCYQTTCSDESDPFIRYAYDAVGNRIAEARPGSTIDYDYDAGDRLLSSSVAGVTTSYEHDANGNMIRAGGRSFAYDEEGRVRSTASGPESTTYAYDGFGNRRRAATGTATSEITDYVWDVNSALPELALERDGSGAMLRRYEHGLALISATGASGRSYFHYDGIGSVTDVTSSAGAPQWEYSYEPFGASRHTAKLDQLAADNPVRYTGQYLDPTGLYHMRARQMDPSLGRFTARDPIAPRLFAPYVSTYAYANNTPTSMVDPAGLEACEVDRGGNPPEAYWNIRSHRDFWAQQEQSGWNNGNEVVGLFQWAGGKIFGGVLDVSGLETVQASAETLGTACTSGYAKFMSGASIIGVGGSWYTGGTAASARLGWSSTLFGRGGNVAKTGSTFKGVLNRRSVRIGWGYHDGGKIFRVGIGSGDGRIHRDLWR